MRRRAFITGITGQDGSYLADLLLEQDYEIYGLVRRTSSLNTSRITHLLNHLRLISGDVTDLPSLQRALRLADPQEVYHFASQSYVQQSFEAPVTTTEITGVGALHLFEAVRTTCSTARVYQASSSEQFGNAVLSPQDEETPFRPVSPYGAAKAFAHSCARIYRDAYQLFISCGISFNHESPRRGTEFVTRKITLAATRIKAGLQETLELGNIYAQRDWSHAKDIVRGAWLSLQADRPDDYVFASGELHSVREFYELAFNYLGLPTDPHVKSIIGQLRPWDVQRLVGNASKAHRLLNWTPTVSFSDLVVEMVDHDRQALPYYSSWTRG